MRRRRRPVRPYLCDLLEPRTVLSAGLRLPPPLIATSRPQDDSGVRALSQILGAYSGEATIEIRPVDDASVRVAFSGAGRAGVPGGAPTLAGTLDVGGYKGSDAPPTEGNWTLADARGTLTLRLEGPYIADSEGTTRLRYTIQAATGAYAGTRRGGWVELTLAEEDPGTTPLKLIPGEAEDHPVRFTLAFRPDARPLAPPRTLPPALAGPYSGTVAAYPAGFYGPGATYSFSGEGPLRARVSLEGTLVVGDPNIPTARAGFLLSNELGSVGVLLEGPAGEGVPGSAPPRSYRFVISRGTGIYAGASGRGTARLRIGPFTGGEAGFVLTLEPAGP